MYQCEISIQEMHLIMVRGLRALPGGTLKSARMLDDAKEQLMSNLRMKRPNLTTIQRRVNTILKGVSL